MTSNTMIVLHERANGVMKDNKFYPFKTVSDASLALSAKQNVRFYVKSINFSVKREGILAAGLTRIQGVISTETVILADIRHPSMTQASDFDSVTNFITVGLLLDRNTAVTVTNAQASGSYQMIYAEVDDV